MGCGCRKKKQAGGYEVWRAGVYTGRTFASLSDAQAYAERIGGEVKTA